MFQLVIVSLSIKFLYFFSTQGVLADSKAAARMEMTEKTWQNPYCTTPESSLPPSRRLSPGRLGELNRPRWGSVWGQDGRSDPPPPSWLSRLGQSSQVMSTDNLLNTFETLNHSRGFKSTLNFYDFYNSILKTNTTYTYCHMLLAL